MNKTIQRVLIYRLGSLGDMLAALPALHLVERAFPGAERRMLTNFPINQKAAAAATVLDPVGGGPGLLQGYFAYPVGARQPMVLLKLWWQLLRWRPQVVVYLAAERGLKVARRDQAFFRSLGARRLVGIPLTEDMQWNRTKPGTRELEPEYDRLARNLAKLGDADTANPASWDLRLTAQERAAAEAALEPAGQRRIIAFSVGTKLQANDWGRERWRELMQGLGARYPGHALVMTGVAGERETSEFVAQGWREGAGGQSVVINLCGALAPRESAACFARADVFLGHDSGPMHLAATVGTRVVAVFSSRNPPGKWFPWGKGHRVFYREVDCMNCGLEVCTVEAKKCIYGIEVGAVLQAAAGVLEAAAGGRQG